MIKIAIGCDHAAFEEKKKIKEYLIKKGYKIFDLGTNSNQSVNYPKYGHQVANMVVDNIVDKGIVICGSGIGKSIAANKVKGARAALCTSCKHAEMSRKHNDANILAVGARFTPLKEIELILETWFKTEFEGGRHLIRINKIEQSE